MVLAILAAATVISIWLAVWATNAEHAHRVARRDAERDREVAVDARQVAETHRIRSEQKAEEARRNLYIAHIQQMELKWSKSNLQRVTELLDRYRRPFVLQAEALLKVED